MDIYKMNIKLILNRILHGIKKTPVILKAIWKTPYFKVYLLLSFLFTFVFVLLTFPLDVIVKNAIHSYESKSGNTVSIGDMSINLFSESELENISVSIKGSDTVFIKSAIINISMNPFTLLMDREIKGDIGVSGIKYTGDNIKIEVAINSNLDIKLNEKTGAIETGKIKIMINNLSVSLNEFSVPEGPLSGFPITRIIRISSIISEMGISNKQLTLSESKISGSDIKAVVSGTVGVGKVSNRLDLKLKVDASSTLLDDFRMFISSMVDANNQIPIEIKGTTSRPKVITPMNKKDEDKPSDLKPVSKSKSRPTPPEQPTMFR